jgi:hypothetical protein
VNSQFVRRVIAQRLGFGSTCPKPGAPDKERRYEVAGRSVSGRVLEFSGEQRQRTTVNLTSCGPRDARALLESVPQN